MNSIGYKRIYLDTSVIVRRPEILATKNNRITLIIPSIVHQELSRHKSQLFALVNKAVEDGFAVLEPSPVEFIKTVGGRIHGIDTIILLQAAKDQKSGTALASDDRDLIVAGPAAGVSIISSQALVELMAEAEWQQ